MEYHLLRRQRIILESSFFKYRKSHQTKYFLFNLLQIFKHVISTFYAKIYEKREVEKILGRKELIQKRIEISIVYYSIYIYVNQHKPADFQNYAWKVVGDICNGLYASESTPALYPVGAPSLPISVCLALESRPVDLGIRRGKGRRDADETSCERGRVDTLQRRGGVECTGVGWLMDIVWNGGGWTMVALVSREKWLPSPSSFPTFCGEIKGMRWMVSVAVLFRDKWKCFLWNTCFNIYLDAIHHLNIG